MMTFNDLCRRTDIRLVGRRIEVTNWNFVYRGVLTKIQWHNNCPYLLKWDLGFKWSFVLGKLVPSSTNSFGFADYHSADYFLGPMEEPNGNIFFISNGKTYFTLFSPSIVLPEDIRSPLECEQLKRQLLFQES